jgi:hypothetical protein
MRARSTAPAGRRRSGPCSRVRRQARRAYPTSRQDPEDRGLGSRVRPRPATGAASPPVPRSPVGQPLRPPPGAAARPGDSAWPPVVGATAWRDAATGPGGSGSPDPSGIPAAANTGPYPGASFCRMSGSVLTSSRSRSRIHAVMAPTWLTCDRQVPPRSRAAGLAIAREQHAKRDCPDFDITLRAPARQAPVTAGFLSRCVIGVRPGLGAHPRRYLKSA